MNDDKNTSLHQSVMDAIHKGHVRMRPRWHFVLLSVLGVSGVLILLLAALYASSLGVFFLRDSGVWFTPSFGPRGWFDLLHSIPWILVLLTVVFIVVLELLVRRYAFVYKKPLLTSALLILLFVVLGGVGIGVTPFHRTLMISARQGDLPPPIDFLYGDAMRMPPPPEVYRGVIVDMAPERIMIVDPDRAGTTTVVFSPRTRLPYGADFSVGETVVIIGDVDASGTLEAFGIRDADD